jgi:hypothetical protein
MLINCDECSAEISDRAAACPRCGCPIEPDRPPTPEERADMDEKFAALMQSHALEKNRRNRFGAIAAFFFILSIGSGIISFAIYQFNGAGLVPAALFIAAFILFVFFAVALERIGKPHGNPNPTNQIICLHCHMRGSVRTKAVSVKKGIDGTKAAAALLTGGLSLGLSGLSRRENLTEAHCDNCGSTWTF